MDTRPLLAPSTAEGLRAFEARHGIERRPLGAGAVVGGVVLFAVATALVGLLVTLVLFLVVPLVAGDAVPFGAVPVVGLVVGGCLVALVFLAVARSRGTEREVRYRVGSFAAANGYEYVPRVEEPAQPGMIFGVGRDRVSTDVVRWSGPRPVEVGNHRYTTGSVRAPETYHWGYVAIALDRRLPQVVLDALDNDSRMSGPSLPAPFDESRRVSLGDEHDRSFALFCPPECDALALTLFTPEILARFRDERGRAVLEAEIVDDRLYVYSSARPLSVPDPATWQWLVGTVAALDARLDRAEEPGTGGGALTDDGSTDRSAAAPEVVPFRRPLPLLAVVPLVVMLGALLLPLLDR